MNTKDRAELEKIVFSGLSEPQKKQINEMLGQVKLAIGLVARLRGPNGCPWDREQNHLTLRQYLIEEAYEVLAVLDRYSSDRDPKIIAKTAPKTEFVPADGRFSVEDEKELCEELGDLLLQVLLHSQLTHERSSFHMGDVCERLTAKLVGRHPHVFGEVKLEHADEVLQNWEASKKKEGKKGLLDGLPKNLPSLQRAARIGEKAHRIGFDWKDWHGAWAKVQEEFHELQVELVQKDGAANQTKVQAAVEHELGDVFFSLCNLARHLSITPEDAHRKAIGRFEKRFARVEEICEAEGIDMHTATLAELDEVWDRVKRELVNE